MDRRKDETILIRVRPRPGAYASGIETTETILRAAADVLIEEGYKSFTLRRVAERSGMKVGNLSYHFPRKEELIRELLEAILNGFREKSAAAIADTGLPPEERIVRLTTLSFREMGTRATTHLFPELWALASHDEFVSDQLKQFYTSLLDGMATNLGAVAPQLSSEQCHEIALLLCATVEGMIVFVGHDRPWAARRSAMRQLTIKSIISLTKAMEADARETADAACELEK